MPLPQWADVHGDPKKNRIEEVMMKKWADDIRQKTEGMDWRQRGEYIGTYYWYHILIGLLLLGLCLLVIYHINWGKQERAFSLALVNQEIDFDRDRVIQEKFSEFSGISEKEILVNSDYLISYEGMKLKEVNESSYEKFFFNWSAGELDAVIMTESFYEYCKTQGGEFAGLSEFLEEETIRGQEKLFYQDKGIATGIYVAQTKLARYLICEGEDDVLLVFPKETRHRAADKKFLEYLLSGEAAEK